MLDRNAIWEKLQGCGKKNIIHMANGSDEDDTVDGDDIFIIYFQFSQRQESRLRAEGYNASATKFVQAALHPGILS